MHALCSFAKQDTFNLYVRGVILGLRHFRVLKRRRAKEYLKIKRHGHIKAATYPVAKKSKHEILDDKQVNEINLDLKKFMEKY